MWAAADGAARPTGPATAGHDAAMTILPPQTDVLLVSMPFGPLRHPSIGLELLKASLDGVSARSLYFTLPYADRIGAALYLSVVRKPVALLGDWIFSAPLFDGDPADADGYLDALGRHDVGARPLPSDHLRLVRDARLDASRFVDECVARILDHQPRLVGLTTVFQQHTASLAVAKRLKAARPDLCVVLGGANCEGAMGLETIRQFPFLDAVFSGEADLVFAPFVRAVLDGRRPDPSPGVYTRAAIADPFARPANAPSVREMDALPVPDYTDFFDQWTQSPPGPGIAPRLLFETSRGCWWGEKHHCTFCGLNGSTMAFRSKSAGRALAELDTLAARHPGRPVMMVDNILDTAYFRDLVPALAARGNGPSLFVEVKANLKKSQVRLLADAGITAIQPGIESLIAPVLDLMRKGVSPLQNVQLLKWCTEYGVWPQWHWIWGFPGEPADGYLQAATIVPLLSHLPPPVVATPIRLDRFSPNFNEAGALGFRDVTPCAAYRAVYPLPAPALANLAYYFDYGYADGRDVEAYTRPLAAAIARWQAEYADSEFYYRDDGTDLWLYDFRPSSAKMTAVLTGLARLVYLECDEVRAESALPARLTRIVGAPCTEADIRRAVDPLVADGAMLRDGGHILSLATSVQAPPRPAADPGLEE
jgi:ribosomal peptide maturation radical SAM protein 1